MRTICTCEFSVHHKLCHRTKIVSSGTIFKSVRVALLLYNYVADHERQFQNDPGYVGGPNANRRPKVSAKTIQKEITTACKHFQDNLDYLPLETLKFGS